MQAQLSDDHQIYGDLLHVPRCGLIDHDPPTASATYPYGADSAETPTYTPTPSPTKLNRDAPPTATQTPTIVLAACDRAQFIADVTVPPGTAMLPGTTFTKTWRVMNVGTCAWTTSYQIVFFRGEQLGAPVSQQLSQTVAVRQSVDISVCAPSTAASISVTGCSGMPVALFGIG
jgi:hypothetical protein